MTAPTYDRDFWEQLWARTLRERADEVARHPPNEHLTREVSGLKPVCLHVHVAGSVQEMVRRMGARVAPGVPRTGRGPLQATEWTP